MNPSCYKVLILSVTCLFTLGCQDYNECVLKNSRDAQTESALQVIASTCEKRFEQTVDPRKAEWVVANASLKNVSKDIRATGSQPPDLLRNQKLEGLVLQAIEETVGDTDIGRASDSKPTINQNRNSQDAGGSDSDPMVEFTVDVSNASVDWRVTSLAFQIVLNWDQKIYDTLVIPVRIDPGKSSKVAGVVLNKRAVIKDGSWDWRLIHITAVSLKPPLVARWSHLLIK